MPRAEQLLRVLLAVRGYPNRAAWLRASGLSSRTIVRMLDGRPVRPSSVRKVAESLGAKASDIEDLVGAAREDRGRS